MQREFGRFVYLADCVPTPAPSGGTDLKDSAYRQFELKLPATTGTRLPSLSDALSRLRGPTAPPGGGPAPVPEVVDAGEFRAELVGVFLVLVAVGGALVSTRLWVPLMVTSVVGCAFVLGVHAWRERGERPAPSAPPPALSLPSAPALLYDLGDAAICERAELAASIPRLLQQANACWLVTSATRVADTRRNAGAGTSIDRVLATIAPWAPVPVNVPAWCVQTSGLRLVFLPDELLVVTYDATWTVPYEELEVVVEQRLFAEEGPRPLDAQQDGTTWRYVRKDGSPDLRFADNAQIPWLQYGNLTLRTKSGWQATIQVSRPDVARHAADGLQTIARGSRPPPPVPVAPPVEPPRNLVSAPPHPSTPAAPAASGRPSTSRPPPPPAAALSAPPPTPTDDAELLGFTLTVLKAVAVADRKFTEEEMVEVREAARALCPGATWTIADPALEERARRQSADAPALDEALARLRGCATPWRQQLVAKAHRIAGADTKVTPKERERLAQIESALAPVRMDP